MGGTFSIALSGLAAQTAALGVVSNDLANLNTMGFKASSVAFHDLVEQRVCRPAAMVDTSFLRSDTLPGGAAGGYLEEDGLRTNVFQPLPVIGHEISKPVVRRIESMIYKRQISRG